MNALAIDIREITKAFDGKVVVDKVTLQVKTGSVFGFLGSNGSGKTTTIRMICGLITPTSGEGHCLGYDIKTESAAIKMRVGYMPQKFSLYNRLTVQENLMFFARIYQIENPKRDIAFVLKELELEPYQHTLAANLSGGWKQRLMLACCILHQPKLLFLDEPTAGVDPKARKDFWNYLHKIALGLGTTVLVTTHYMDEAEKCTDLAYINLGKLLYSGATQDLVPFSQVKTYQMTLNRALLNTVSDLIKRDYPKLLISVVNNDVRISSLDARTLQQFMAAQSKAVFTEVPPSFEEVFIGLMQ